ncbi:MAG: hypothetical protein JWL79_3092 [Frankiales bacterium]|nr:hypothetical protein [Frankiales bacterium]
MTRETNVMHDLYHRHPRIKAAEHQLAEAKSASADLTARSDAAIAKHEQAKQEALDRGEVLAPVLEPIPSREVRGRADRQIAAAEAPLDRARAEIAVELSQQLEQREAEILEQATSTPVGDLGPLLNEVNQLLMTKRLLAGSYRRVSRAQGSGPAAAVVAPVKSEASLTDLVLAATTGTGMLGVTADPVERRVVDFFSPEGEAAMRHSFAGEGTSG